MPKKSRTPRRKRLSRQGRLNSAVEWVEKYNGKNIIAGYAKWFGVDKICAIKELKSIGVVFPENLVNQIIASHKSRLKQKRIIQQWFYDSVSIYNKLVCHFTQIYTKYEKIAIREANEDNTKEYLLAKLLKNNKEFPLNFRKMRDLKIDTFAEDYCRTPYCVIADIIKDFVANVKSCVK